MTWDDGFGTEPDVPSRGTGPTGLPPDDDAEAAANDAAGRAWEHEAAEPAEQDEPPEGVVFDQDGRPRNASGWGIPLDEGPDYCPDCHRRVTDYDPDGLELATGQRVCRAHLTTPRVLGALFAGIADHLARLEERIDDLETRGYDLAGQLDHERGRAAALEDDRARLEDELHRTQADVYALEQKTPGRGW